jgi:hypothetical protein
MIVGQITSDGAADPIFHPRKAGGSLLQSYKLLHLHIITEYTSEKEVLADTGIANSHRLAVPRRRVALVTVTTCDLQVFSVYSATMGSSPASIKLGTPRL